MGSWKLVSAQASVTPPDKLSVTDLHGQVHVLMSGETRLDFSAKADGKETAVAGNPAFDHVVLHKIDKRQGELNELKNGAVVATVRESLSKDGNELTLTTVSPGHANQVTVWVRTGGAKTAGDPNAGEWTADLGKSLMRQGMDLKIEPDAGDGVRFLGSYSYTARFDGKPYEVRNSPNDTVTLQLLDAHTVDATYQRDNQVSQRERWVVSADGRQMTVNSTATLEDGQRLTEALVFKKQ